MAHIVDMKIIRTKPYLRSIKKIGISADNERELFEELKNNPKKGEVIIGSGGARKIRIAFGNRGKSKGARIIYHFIEIKGTIYLLGAYAKANQANLSRAQINELKEIKSILEN